MSEREREVHKYEENIILFKIQLQKFFLYNLSTYNPLNYTVFARIESTTVLSITASWINYFMEPTTRLLPRFRHTLTYLHCEEYSSNTLFRL